MQTLTIAEPSQYRPHLDGLRGIAVISVILFHSSLEGHLPFFFDGLIEGRRLLRFGVQVFFVVSAYSLFLTAYSRKETGMSAAGRFYVRRLFRILPLWWAVCVFAWLAQGQPGFKAFTSATFAFGFMNNSYDHLVSGIGWSLFVEECFYLLFPLTIGLITSTGRAALTVIATVLLYYFYNQVLDVHTTTMVPHVITNANLFALGIFFWFLTGEAWFQQLAKRRDVRWGLDFVAATSLVGVAFSNRLGAHFLLATFVLAGLVAGTVVRRICEMRVFTFPGGLCYGLYLLHPHVGTLVADPLVAGVYGSVSTGEAQTLIIFFVKIGATTLFAFASFKYFERPLVEWGRRLLKYGEKH